MIEEKSIHHFGVGQGLVTAKSHSSNNFRLFKFFEKPLEETFKLIIGQHNRGSYNITLHYKIKGRSSIQNRASFLKILCIAAD